MPSRELSALDKRIWTAIDAIQNRYERELLINYKQALDSVRLQLSKVYEKYAKEGALTYAEMSKYNRLQNLHNELASVMGETFSRNGKLVEKLRLVQYNEAFYRSGWALDQAVGVKLQWGKIPTEAVKAAVNAGGTRELLNISIKNAKASNLIGIDRTVTQGLIRGDSYPKIATEIKKVFDRAASSYTTIARTEGQRAAVLGQQATYEQAEQDGIELDEIWDATLDNRTRPSHGALDGKPKDKEHDGWYVSGIGWVAGPMQSGDPGFDINCRCRVRGQIKDYAPKVRRVRDEGVQPYQTYEQWAKNHE